MPLVPVPIASRLVLIPVFPSVTVSLASIFLSSFGNAAIRAAKPLAPNPRHAASGPPNPAAPPNPLAQRLPLRKLRAAKTLVASYEPPHDYQARSCVHE